jgi:hypothetical protein
MPVTKKIAFGIPYFNDEKALASSFEVLSVLDGRMQKIDTYEHKFVIYDDGSDLGQSNTLQNQIKSQSFMQKSCIYDRSDINRGYGYACQRIKSIAIENKYDFLLILDSELSMTIEDIFKAIEIWEKYEPLFNTDESGIIIKPSRFLSKHGLQELSGSRKIWSRAGNLFARATIGGCSDPTNGFRGLNLVSLNRLNNVKFNERGFAHIVEEMYWSHRLGMRLLECESTYKVRSDLLRESTFLYSREVLSSYMKHCIRTLIFRISSRMYKC